MNHYPTPPPPPKSRWTKRGWWIFIFLNIAGLLLIIPLLSAIGPLVGIWWNTRSQDSVTRQVADSRKDSAASAPASKPGTSSSPLPPSPQSTADADLAALTNQLNLVKGLSDEEIKKMVAKQFGQKKKPQGDPSKFDRGSAVFHKIERTVATIQGKEYFCYEIDLADQNGNHTIQVDCFDKPDVDYERSMATLQLIEKNPQLKSIYTAFSHVLAEKAEKADTNKSQPVAPAIRFEGKLPVPPKVQ